MNPQTRQRLFLAVIKKYNVLFWACLFGFVVSGACALIGFHPKSALALAGLCLVGMLRAPIAAWAKRTKTGVPGYEDEVETRDLLGDALREEDARDETVTVVEPEDDPERPSGSSPPLG